MRDRGSVIITKDDSILLIKRKTNGDDYLMFPGGGVEPSETPEEVAFKLMATLTKKTLEVGGFTKEQLIKLLHEHDVLVNDYGEQLLADETFSCSKNTHTLEIIEVTVKSLGFLHGATLPEIYQRAQELGLTLCSLETGIYLRLMYFDQPIAESSLQNQAPSESITIASKPISENHDIPKGFYLRNIDGQLWLRGYTADDLHVWNPDDHFVFEKTMEEKN